MITYKFWSLNTFNIGLFFFFSNANKPIIFIFWHTAWRLENPEWQISTISASSSISLRLPTFIAAPLRFFSDLPKRHLKSIDEPIVSSESQHPESKSFTDAQYTALLDHMTRYVDTMLTQKLHSAEETLSPTTITNIAHTVHQHLSQHQFVLSPADVDRVADIVRAQLIAQQTASDKDAPPPVLTNDHKTLVSQLIKERIASEHQHQRTPEIDVDAIITRVLTSPKLLPLIDERIADQSRSNSALILQQSLLIDALRDEIEAIQTKLATHSDVHQHVQQTLQLLQTHYDSLGSQFDAYRRENEARFANLLRDVEFNFTQSGAQQSAGVDTRIKVLLLDIFGYKNAANETPPDADLRGWIRSVFVAKDVLEERLRALQMESDARLVAEMGRTADMLMGDIGAQIRQQSVELIELNNAKIANNPEAVTRRELDEEEIKRIVAEAIAVYDADKTGLVDYALESAGGEIMSTR